MSDDQIISWLEATLRWGGPLILVSVGEVFAERSGVINVGIEGIMLCGALAGIAISYFTGNVLIATNWHNAPWRLARDSVRLLNGNAKDQSGCHWPHVQPCSSRRDQSSVRLDLADPVRAGSDLPAAVPRELR